MKFTVAVHPELFVLSAFILGHESGLRFRHEPFRVSDSRSIDIQFFFQRQNSQ